MGVESAMRPPMRLWAVIVAGGASVVAAAVAAQGDGVPPVWRLAVAFAVFLLGDVALLHIRFGRDQNSFTMSETALVIALVLLPGPWLVLVAPPAVAIAHLAARRSPLKVAYNASSSATAVLLATAVFLIAGDVGPSVVVTCLALSAAAVTYFGWNSATMAVAVAWAQGLPIATVYSKGLLLCVLVLIGNTCVGLLLVVLGGSQPAVVVAIPALLVLLYFVYWSYLRAMHDRDVWQMLQATSRELVRVEPSEVAHVVMAHTPALFGADLVELLLVDSETAKVATVYRSSSRGREIDVFESRLDRPDPFWGRAVAERESFDVVTAGAPAGQRRELESLGLVRCVVVPLLAQDTIIGTLRIGFRGAVPFGAREMQVLTTFANHVSAAVHNTRLFGAMRIQALSDPLTGLANRTMLLDRLRQAQARSARRDDHVALVFLDLDRFKIVNDSLGHDAGDHLLQLVGARISAALRSSDTAARFGGDEFVVLCEGVAGPREAQAFAERIAACLRDPFVVRGEQVFVTASVGVAIATSPYDDPIALVRDADAAMYEAKGRGPARCELFDGEMRERAVARLEMENDLRRAVDGGELQLHYQPNIRLADEGLVGVEALARWDHAERGPIPPSEFIPLAEETGLIVAIGDWVIDMACRQLAEWTRLGCVADGDLYVAINLSPHQLSHPSLLHHVARSLLTHAVDPHQICFEITESALLGDLSAAREVLHRLRDLGVRIALDDFGTGYSSLSYLQQLPVDVLKLDRSFVARLGPEPRDRAVVAGMVELAHALDLTVVAEGVETPEQLADLRELGCDVVQGFHYSRPKTGRELDGVLAGRRGATPLASLRAVPDDYDDVLTLPA